MIRRRGTGVWSAQVAHGALPLDARLAAETAAANTLPAIAFGRPPAATAEAFACLSGHGSSPLRMDRL